MIPSKAKSWGHDLCWCDSLLTLVTLPHSILLVYCSLNQDESAADFDLLWLGDRMDWALVGPDLKNTFTLCKLLLQPGQPESHWSTVQPSFYKANNKEKRNWACYQACADGRSKGCGLLKTNPNIYSFKLMVNTVIWAHKAINSPPTAKVLIRYQPSWMSLAFVVCVQSPFVSVFIFSAQHMSVWSQ